ncbi:toxin coregulated pilus biosynthesis protein TcpD [Aliivibrio fischeri ES114]|uniref:Toxin coregulated pilus biosynthesis protein TcpD n=1 Tax=Aliivibrio fischeri (strain ATCC 700601 / ES114) TaxID=312309 RepID=Q5DZ56_ALIF1|nr:toxin-coregulated pilus protein TcpD [Aliivibrio fischeri]AAW87940.1 toxin coregulated pilus biosynthesis protein TcpD [Aliivibrio fischeri ES114]KLU80425.1 hypothetical protein AB192_00940 [Aliivibrio fischeri]
MVILDNIKNKQNRIVVIISFFLISLILVLSFIFFNKYKENEKIRKFQEQKRVEETNDRDMYISTLDNFNSSFSIQNFREIYDDLYRDKVFFHPLGWIQNEVYCNGNECNIKYIRSEPDAFNYVVLTKNNLDYPPAFNKNELNYESVFFDFSENKKILKDKVNYANCTDILSKAYRFDTMINSIGSNLEVLSPSNVFLINKEYEWMEYKNLMQGQLILNTSEFQSLDLIDDFFNGDFVTYGEMNLRNNDATIYFNYLCLN